MEKPASNYDLLKQLQKSGVGIRQLPNTTSSIAQRKEYRLEALYIYEAIRRAKQELYGISERCESAKWLAEQCSLLMEKLDNEFGVLYQIHDFELEHSFLLQGSFLGNGVEHWLSEFANKYRKENADKHFLQLITEDHPKFVLAANGELT